MNVVSRQLSEKLRLVFYFHLFEIKKNRHSFCKNGLPTAYLVSSWTCKTFNAVKLPPGWGEFFQCITNMVNKEDVNNATVDQSQFLWSASPQDVVAFLGRLQHNLCSA